jgi:NADH-quinone oxidoreductase subunit J
MTGDLLSNLPYLVFLCIGALAITSAILVVASRNPVHSALFLLLTFLCVAVLFIIKAAEFVAAVQILVYAGGVMVLFLFVVMLINVRSLPSEKILERLWKGGLAIGLMLFALLFTVARNSDLAVPVDDPQSMQRTVPVATDASKTGEIVGNSEAIGMLLYRQYLVPFEVASIFLLVAMIGAIIIGKRELSHIEEETAPDYMLERVATEKRVKEGASAFN